MKNTPLPLQVWIRKDQGHRVFAFGSTCTIAALDHGIHLFLALSPGPEYTILRTEKLANQGNVSAPVVAVVGDEDGGDVGLGEIVFLPLRC
jgi:hypothetical protein